MAKIQLRHPQNDLKTKNFKKNIFQKINFFKILMPIFRFLGQFSKEEIDF